MRSLRSEYSCCICKHTVLPEGPDPCSVTIRPRWDTYRADGDANPPTQMLFAHFACLERHVYYLDNEILNPDIANPS